MFEGLDDIDWSALQHAYGPAHRVPELLRSLRADDPQVRRRALIGWYSTLHHDGAVYDSMVAALPYLIAIAEDPDTSDRLAIVGLLSSVGESAVERTGRSESNHDAQAAAVLRAHAAAFERFACDADPAVRETAVRAFAWCGEDTADAFLRTRFRTEPGLAVRLAILETVAALTSRDDTMPTEAWEWFGAVSRDVHVPPVARLAAIVQSARYAPERIDDGLVERGVDLLAQARFDSGESASPTANADMPPEAVASPGDRHHETTTATELGDCFHEALGERLADRIVLVRAQLAHANDTVRLDGIHTARAIIGAWRSRYEPLVDALAEQLHGIGPVGAHAAHALGMCAPVAGAAADPLAAYLTSLTGEHSAAAWQATDARLQAPFQEALVALAQLEDLRAVPYLAQALDSGVDMGEAARAAGRLPEAAEVLAPRIAAYLSGLDLASRRDNTNAAAALHALGKLGHAGTADAVMESLAASIATSDDTPSVTPAALTALAGLGSAAHAAADTVRTLTDAINPHVQSAAAKAWWRITGDRDTTLSFARELLDASAWFTVRNGAALLAELGPDAASALPRLRELMDHEEVWVRVQAADAAWAIGGDSETTAVLDVLLEAWDRKAATGCVVAPCLKRMGDAAAPALERVHLELAKTHRANFTRLRDDETILFHCRAILATRGQSRW